VVDRQLARSLSVMSLAHLRIPKLGRGVSPATVPAVKTASPLGSYCGATREPIYRTMDEATESGLEICGSCLADFRRQRKAH
jgi:hypothetical protein